MRVLIIGSEGFIGSHLCDLWSGHALFTADILPSGRGGQHRLMGDGDFHTLFAETKPDLCINASGAADVAASFTDPERDRLLNLTNIELMLEALAEESPQTAFINISSAAVYGSPDALPIKEGGDEALKPISPYGQHKLEAEKTLLRFHREHGIATLSARVFSCYGPGQQKLLFYDMYRKAELTGFKSVELFGSGDESRDYIHVQDLVLALKMLALKGAHLFMGGAVNVASGEEVRISEVAHMAAAYIDPGLEVRFTGEHHQGYPQRWQADVSLLRSLGFSTNKALDQGLEGYYRWLKSVWR